MAKLSNSVPNNIRVYALSVLSGVAAILLAVSVVAAPLSAKEPRFAHQKGTKVVSTADSRGFIDNAGRIQRAFRERNRFAYRTALFQAIYDMRAQRPSALAIRTVALLRYVAESGTDGLESLVLSYVDAAAQRAAPLYGKMVTTTIADTLAKLKWKDQAPGINIARPLGRMGTPYVLDVRADALVATIRRLGKLPNGQRLPTLDDLLGLPSMNEDLCNLPEQLDQNGQVPPADQTRMENCARTGRPGGSGGGAVSGAFGPSSMGACLGGRFAELRETAQRLNDLEACMNATEQAGAAANPLALGPAAVLLWWAALSAGEQITVGIAVGGAAGALGYKILDRHVANRDAVQDARDEVRDAQRDEDSAWEEYDDALDAWSEAQGEVEELEQQIEEANDSGASQEEIGELNKKLDAAKKEAKTKSDTLTAASRKVGAAEQKTKDKKEKLEEKKDNAAQPRPGEESQGLADVPACRRLIFGGLDFKDPVAMKRLKEDWLDLKAKVGGGGRPDPEGEATGVKGVVKHDYCGLDDNTLVNEGEGCKALIDCPPDAVPTESCGCRPRGTASPDQFKHALCFTQRCSQGQMPVSVGQMCSCQSDEPPPSGRPPTGPDPAEIQAFFERHDAKGTTFTKAHEDPLGAMLENIFMNSSSRLAREESLGPR